MKSKSAVKMKPINFEPQTKKLRTEQEQIVINDDDVDLVIDDTYLDNKEPDE